MFCSNCGAKAAGNFCAGCGAKLAAPDFEGSSPQDWADEDRYHVLLHFSDVRDLIARSAAKAPKGLTGEQFLKVCDAAFGKLMGGVALTTVATLAVPLYSRMGIHTGKKRTEVLRRPIGKVVVAAICSLARYGRSLKDVHQGADGCVLEALMPPDLRSLEGELIISIHRDGSATQVEATTNIPGQLYDWGKCNKCLNQLFEDLEALAN